MKKILMLVLVFVLFLLVGDFFINRIEVTPEGISNVASDILHQKILREDIPIAAHNNMIVDSAREQMGVVTSYDNQYYAGGYPPSDRGACTDVVAQALHDLGYNFKDRLDTDMRENPDTYTREYDSNINFRRVNNVEVYLGRYAKSLDTNFPQENNDNEMDWSDWLPGDIVTFDQIPGQLWHIAIVSDYAAHDGTPLLIHNHGNGTVENNMLLYWPSEVTGRYRLLLDEANV